MSSKSIDKIENVCYYVLLWLGCGLAIKQLQGKLLKYGADLIKADGKSSEDVCNKKL